MAGLPPADPRRLSTRLPPASFLVPNEHDDLVERGIPAETLLPPNPLVVQEARRALPRNNAEAMVAEATRGALVRLYGDTFTSEAAQRLQAQLVHRRDGSRNLPRAIGNFVRCFMHGIYSEQPHIYARIAPLLRQYRINDEFLVVTHIGRSLREWRDIHVPGLVLPVAPAGGHYALSFERSADLTLGAFPAPLPLKNGNGVTPTQACADFWGGDWNRERKRSTIDSDVMADWDVLPEDMSRVSWTFDRLEHSNPLDNPQQQQQPNIAIWKLVLHDLNGTERRYRVHFDARMWVLQQERLNEFEVHPKTAQDGSRGVSVRARKRDERPLIPVIARPQPGQQ